MDKVFIPVLIMLFVAVLSFFIANTAAYIMFPIFDNMSASMGFMQNGAVDYTSQAVIAKTAFFTAIFIVVAIPIAFLLFRLIRKENEPQQQPQYYSGGYW